MESIQVLYEDPAFLIVRKPRGLLVHGLPHMKTGVPEPTLADWLAEHYPEVTKVGDDPIVRPGIVHRLDRDTSGVLLVARTQAAFDYFKKLFQTRDIKKTYLAAVAGHLKESSGTIDTPIGIKNGTVKRTVHGGRMVKPAVTDYRVLAEKMIDTVPKKNDADGETIISLLEVSPRTGRTHQIRVHLASIGYPILGDRIYGHGKARTQTNIPLMLHALSLEFTAPDGKRISIAADPPEEFQELSTRAVWEK